MSRKLNATLATRFYFLHMKFPKSFPHQNEKKI